MIRQRNPIKRTVAPRKSRGVRRGPWRSEKYRRWIAGHACIVCGHPETQAAHTERNGMSSKGSDASCVPLCVDHHNHLDGRTHPWGTGGPLGRLGFQDFYGINLASEAADLYREWSKPEPECNCYCVGDQADASACGLHGGRA